MSMYGTDYPEAYDPGPENDPAETPGERAKRLFPRLDWVALWAEDDEEEWIHDPLLPARRSVVIYSAPKVGKSLLMLEMAVAISRGEVFLDYTGRQVRVLYVDFENDPRGDVRSRLQAMDYGPADLEGLDYLSYPSMAGLDTERGSLELLEAVKAYGSEVVIIDTVSRAVDGEENSNDTYLQMYRHTGLALKRAGVAVIRLDHSGKDETKGQRGASAKSGDVDAVWRLTRVTDDRFRLDCTDSRMSMTIKSLHLQRHVTPRLHHSVIVSGAVSDFTAKVAALVELLDSNGIPTLANRKTVHDFAKSRGMVAGNLILQEVVRLRKATAGGEFPHNSPPLPAPPDLLNSPPEFTPSEEPPKLPDLSTDHLNSGSRIQQNSPQIGTPEFLGSSINTAQENSPIQADRKCGYCHTEPEPPGGGLCSTCTDLIKAAS
jgi:KaiC/GvpD/RAD55 family RecA-like ATPase